MKKKILITLLVITGLFATNVLYWTLSDVQQECYLKIKNNKELNFYEKASIYSLNLCICVFGWPLSPEATIQQILCTVPTEDTIILHSDHFSNHEKIRGLIKKYPNATVHRPAKVAWSPDFNEFGLWSAYTFNNARIGLACNGMYLYKEDGKWVISYIQEFAFPKLPEPTIIGPFKFHESLIRYLQDNGWLYKPKFKWVLDVEEEEG
jgi:hypothetical protein